MKLPIVPSSSQMARVLMKKVKASTKTTAGTIKKIAQAVIDGSSHYYIVLNDSDTIYDVDISKYLDAILLEEGDKVTIEYTEGNPSTVSKISKS